MAAHLGTPSAVGMGSDTTTARGVWTVNLSSIGDCKSLDVRLGLECLWRNKTEGNKNLRVF